MSALTDHNQDVPPSDRKVRVLLIAEEANPQWTSVPLLGWCHSQMIRECCDAHLVTQIRNRDAITAAGLKEGEHFTAIDSEAVARIVYKVIGWLRGGPDKGWTTVTALNSIAYYYFESLVWKQFRSQLERREFDLVHRLTPLSPATPSLIGRRCHRLGVPFVLGPLNGGVPWPKSFAAERRKEGEWLSYVRSLYKLLPGYSSTRRCASAILIGSRVTWNQMPARYHPKCVYVPENGVDPTRFAEPRDERRDGPLRLVFIGRLVPCKGTDMLVEAVTELAQRKLVSLDIFGDGPMMPQLQTMVADRSLADSVRLHGWIAHEQLQDRLRQAQLLTFPSIREFGGGVVVEAMAMGIVPVVVNYGGPADLVTDRTGYLVELGTREQIISRFRQVLTRIANDPTPLFNKRRAALRRVETSFTWKVKARQSHEVYRWVLGLRNKPDFGMPIPDREPVQVLESTSTASA